MTWRDHFKSFKRNFRYVLIRGITRAISDQPVERLPKIKNLLMKCLPLFFQKEMMRARGFFPPSFS
jgi:hypothetical protein